MSNLYDIAINWPEKYKTEHVLNYKFTNQLSYVKWDVILSSEFHLNPALNNTGILLIHFTTRSYPRNTRLFYYLQHVCFPYSPCDI